MYRYVGLVWDLTNSIQCEAVAVAERQLRRTDSWAKTFDRGGLRVFHSGELHRSHRSIVLHEGKGVVIGSLFRRREEGITAVVDPLGEFETAEIQRTRALHLVEKYWGSYVAFVVKPSNQGTVVLRSPCGFLGCFFVRLHGAYIFFSRTEDCASLNLVRLTVNWNRVVSHAVDSTVVNSRSAINEISDVAAGECVQAAPERVTVQRYWHPQAVADCDPIESDERALSEVRRALKYTVHNLVRGHDTIAHTLSGGLDSSIVLSGLQDAPTHPKVVCKTFFSPGSDTDERCFARLAARRAGCEHVETLRNPDIRLERMLHGVRTAVPSMFLLELLNTEPTKEFATRIGASAISTGVQGDAVFLHAPALPAATDYLLRYGLRKDFRRLVLDIARIEELSVWKVFGVSFCNRFFGSEGLTFAKIRASAMRKSFTSALINPSVLQERTHYDAGLDLEENDARRLPPGKLWHIYQTVLGSWEDPFSHPADPERIHPIASQPLTEVCLRIPTYLHFRYGWRRSIARRAFSGDVPMEILKRFEKGGQEEHAKEVAHRNIGFMREILLDGRLIREKILNRGAVEDALSERPTRSNAGPVQLMVFVGVEAWLQLWERPLVTGRLPVAIAT